MPSNARRLSAALLTAIVLLLLGALLLSPAAQAAPAFETELFLESAANSTAQPGKQLVYRIDLRNYGSGPTTDDNGTPGDQSDDFPLPIEFTGTLPAGFTVADSTTTEPAFDPAVFDGGNPVPVSCSAGNGVDPIGGASSFKCVDSSALNTEFSAGGNYAFHVLVIAVNVAEGAPLGIATASFAASGGGAEPVSTVDPTEVAPTPPGFDIDAFDLRAQEEDDSPFTQAASAPPSVLTDIDITRISRKPPTFVAGDTFQLGDLSPSEPAKDVVVDLPPGLVGNPTGLPQCKMNELVNSVQSTPEPLCPPESQVGTIQLRNRLFEGINLAAKVPVFNMVPRTGAPARFGFVAAFNTPFLFDAELRQGPPYHLAINSPYVQESISLTGIRLDMWGVPQDPSHTPERACPGRTPPVSSGASCPSNLPPKPFIRLPTSCQGPTSISLAVDSWDKPGAKDSLGSPVLSDPNWKTTTITSHKPAGYPAHPSEWGDPQGTTGCDAVPFSPKLGAQSSSHSVSSPTGLNVRLEVPNPGLENPTGIASSDVKKTVVTLPEGVTINPSAAEGQGVCTPAQYEREKLDSAFGQGCPGESKLGTVRIDSPLVTKPLEGNVFLAQPDDPATGASGSENPFDSLLAMYIVAKDFQQGLLIKLPGAVRTDERTGQITTTFDDLPQLPFSSFELRLREGVRASLVSPGACGTYETVAEFTPWADPGKVITSKSSFTIDRGFDGGACPSGGLPPFSPDLIAGTRNPNAGSYSPFDVRLFRSDAEQQFTHFSVKLPPGVLAKLAGVSRCPDAALAVAKSKTGAAELASPSCPASSEIGRTIVGAGVGSVQTYVPGKIYLTGPYNGSRISIAAITAAKVGPFDLGTVIVRQALRLDPETGEVFVDATGSDPLPHIIKGIPTKLRDIRAYVERPGFVVNPTSCDETSVASTVLGSGIDFASPADDRPVTVSTRFQAANCLALPFEPKVRFDFRGNTRRAGHPSLKVTLTAVAANEANISWTQTTLPKAAFLAQSHIRTICTRVQFAKGVHPGEQCPPGSVYGRARASTPLLDEVMEGPVFLRSSEHKLPDLVIALRSTPVDVNLVGRIDSGKNGELRATFESVPDAFVSKFVLEMFGGKRGLIENSANLCRGKHRATILLDAHNGKTHDLRPLVKASCGKKGKKRAGARGRARAR